MPIVGGVLLILGGALITWGGISGTLPTILAAVINPAWVGAPTSPSTAPGSTPVPSGALAPGGHPATGPQVA
ncbi:MAG TPA: hypothetical protein VMW47_11205 [Verrucomicrobiae bacterium]|nr:hypothetical protein [Verrucomicrobiae bacterium]